MIHAMVPCNGCTACCINDLIFLKPEFGDRVEDHAGNTVEASNPLTGERGVALKHKPKREGGGCIYLGPTGCTIHGRAPAVCRAFDCRRLYLSLFDIPRVERRRLQRDLQKRGLMSREVIEAGKARLHTLEKAA